MMESMKKDSINFDEKRLIIIDHNKNNICHLNRELNEENQIKTKIQSRNIIKSNIITNFIYKKNIIIDKSAKNFLISWKASYLNIIILFLIFQKCSTILCQRLIYSCMYSITIKINNTGKQSIYKKESCHTEGNTENPEEVYINDIEQSPIKQEYTLNETENVIKLIWKEPKNNWGCLFHSLKNIIDIDFSNFDFSKGLYANTIFSGCTSLTSINFNYNGTIKIMDAGSMFRECHSLIYLNISNFDISEVKDIGGMFCGCKSLTSLDLSNFYDLDLTTATILFNDCSNLEYINLSNAHFNDDFNKDNMFSSGKNFVVCTYDNKLYSIINNEYKCATIDCSDNWREKQKKINPYDNNKCVDDCFETNYMYNYKSKCIDICPNRTYNNSFTCEDCHSDCKTCEKSYDLKSTNCKSCLSPDKYLYSVNYISNFTKCFFMMKMIIQ